MADAESEFDMVSHFGAVDELIQLIYQGANKFVLLSAVDSVRWTLHLGLTGAGRWWKGKWTEKDIFKFLGNNRASTKLIEMFAERLADNVIKGELFIGNWNTEQGSDITLTLNPSAKSPVHIPLEELEPKDAAAYAAKMFAEIASQAQKTRGCRLHPSAPLVDPSYHIPSDQQPRQAQTSSGSTSSTSGGLTKKSAKPLRHEPTVAEIQAGQEITELKAELARAQQEIKEVKRKAETSNPDSLLASRAKTVAPAVRPVKGASLANPNKKARRFQAMEFED